MKQAAQLIEVDYYTIDHGKIVSLPVKEYVQPEKSIEEQMMDFVGRQLLWLVPALLVVILAYHFNLWVIPAALSAAGLGWVCRRLGWW